MKIEDAQLCLILGATQAASPGCSDLCRAAIAGGVDLIQLAVDPQADADLQPVREVCRSDDALLVVDGSPEMAAEIDADGVHLSSANAHIGYARSVVGDDRLIGLSSRTADEATMALDLDPDYLLHYSEGRSAAALAGMRASRSVLFVAGISGLEDARDVVEGGVYRLAVGLAEEESAVTEQMAGFSRLLGRCI